MSNKQNSKPSASDVELNRQDEFKNYWSANPLKICGHIPKLYEWYMGKDVYPISIEIGLTSLCNHECVWCSIDTKEVPRNEFLSNDLLKQFVHDIKEMEVRSVVISGSGEQTLHPQFAHFLRDLKEAGIHIGVNTNGSNLTEPICRSIVENATWIRVSLDGATEPVRKAVHGSSDLHKAVSGLKMLVALKKESGRIIPIGTQMVVCPENENEIEACTALSSSIGVDYHQIKPVSYFEVYYPKESDIKKIMEKWLNEAVGVSGKFSRDGFSVNLRRDQFLDYTKNDSSKESETLMPCLTTFSPYIEADGNVWFCVDKKGADEYWLGNLNKNSLKEIWHGNRRKEVLDYIKEHPCNHICRNSPLNEFLWEMKNPSPFHDFL